MEELREDGFIMEECEVNKTGQCALHGVEIERRKSTQKEIAFLKEALKESESHISSLLTVKNKLLGLSVLGGTILVGGYLYTHDHITTARLTYAEVAAELKIMSEEIHTQERDIASVREVLVREEERARGISARLGSIDARLGQMVGLLLKENKITAEELIKLDGEN